MPCCGLNSLGTLLRRLEILPQGEIGGLVNLAVLAQAAVIAVLVLLVPLAAPRRLRAGSAGLLRAAVYFPALALGFLFIEIALIERASFWLNDRTSGFAMVLTGMLVFSGLGSMAADRLAVAPRMAMAGAALVVLAWCAAVLAGLQPLMLATLDWPWLARAGLVLAVLAPVSLALGLPFPLGLARVGNGGVLPWAWGLNGAFSVVATPLANLVAREAGPRTIFWSRRPCSTRWRWPASRPSARHAPGRRRPPRRDERWSSDRVEDQALRFTRLPCGAGRRGAGTAELCGAARCAIALTCLIGVGKPARGKFGRSDFAARRAGFGRRFRLLARGPGGECLDA